MDFLDIPKRTTGQQNLWTNINRRFWYSDWGFAKYINGLS